MIDYADEVHKLLAACGYCQRLDHIGEGIYKWHSAKTGIAFNVEPVYLSLRAANEVLTRAGVGPIIKAKRSQE